MSDKLELALHLIAMGLGVRPHTRLSDQTGNGLMKQVLVAFITLLVMGVSSGVGSAWFMLQNDSRLLAQQSVHNADYQEAVNALPKQEVINQQVTDELAQISLQLKDQSRELRVLAHR